MRRIFSDFEILKLVKDHEAPGVLLKAIKPLNYSPNEPQDISPYSTILGQRTASIPKPQEIPFSRKVKLLTFRVIYFVYSMTNRLLRVIAD